MKHTMPKNKRQFEQCLERAFLSGCNWGYCVEHTANIIEQEQLGADMYIGRISNEDGYEKLQKLQGG